MKNKNNIEPDSVKLLDDLGSDTSPKNQGGTKHWTKKTKIIVILSIIFAILLGAGVFAYFKYYKAKKRDLSVKTVDQVSSKPKTLPSPLTGLEVDEDLAKRPIVSVVVENLYPNARPQSGLSSAGVVYETLAEGGITRYEAVFGDQKPADVGPVRSLRTYFVNWGMEYNAPVVHAGGNADALDLAASLGMKDLNAFTNGDYFRRINTRFSPHNLYISGDNLDQLVKDKGFDTQPDFTPWPRKDDQKADSPNATDINIDFSFKDYDVNYKYNPANNSYLRFLRGKEDIDINTNSQIEIKNLIVIYVPTSFGRTRTNEATVIEQLVGSGNAKIFMDGNVTDAKWSKSSPTSRTIFLDVNGGEIKLNRGISWVAAIPTTKSVTY